jgi:hypothetical protein
MKPSESAVDFLCIGAQKAGTTWLTANLKVHPKVWTPPFIKELHYFDAVHIGTSKERLLHRFLKRGTRMVENHPERREYFDKVMDPASAFTDAWYRHVFSLAPKRAKKGESTPLYCALNDDGVAHVKRLMPDVRLIYMVRDPFDRAMSSFRMEMDIAETLEGAELAHVLDRKLFARRGDYAANIPRWERFFDPAQILYIPFGRLKTEPLAVMRDVERHLGLEEFANYPKLGRPVNTTLKEGKNIGDDIIEQVRRMVEPQYPFLAERFGESFVALTK